MSRDAPNTREATMLLAQSYGAVDPLPLLSQVSRAGNACDDIMTCFARAAAREQETDNAANGVLLKRLVYEYNAMLDSVCLSAFGRCVHSGASATDREGACGGRPPVGNAAAAASAPAQRALETAGATVRFWSAHQPAFYRTCVEECLRCLTEARCAGNSSPVEAPLTAEETLACAVRLQAGPLRSLQRACSLVTAAFQHALFGATVPHAVCLPSGTDPRRGGAACGQRTVTMRYGVVGERGARLLAPGASPLLDLADDGDDALAAVDALRCELQGSRAAVTQMVRVLHTHRRRTHLRGVLAAAQVAMARLGPLTSFHECIAREDYGAALRALDSLRELTSGPRDTETVEAPADSAAEPTTGRLAQSVLRQVALHGPASIHRGLRAHLRRLLFLLRDTAAAPTNSVAAVESVHRLVHGLYQVSVSAASKPLPPFSASAMLRRGLGAAFLGELSAVLVRLLASEDDTAAAPARRGEQDGELDDSNGDLAPMLRANRLGDAGEQEAEVGRAARRVLELLSCLTGGESGPRCLTLVLARAGALVRGAAKLHSALNDLRERCAQYGSAAQKAEDASAEARVLGEVEAAQRVLHTSIFDDLFEIQVLRRSHANRIDAEGGTGRRNSDADASMNAASVDVLSFLVQLLSDVHVASLAVMHALYLVPMLLHTVPALCQPLLTLGDGLADYALLLRWVRMCAVPSTELAAADGDEQHVDGGDAAVALAQRAHDMLLAALQDLIHTGHVPSVLDQLMDCLRIDTGALAAVTAGDLPLLRFLLPRTADDAACDGAAPWWRYLCVPVHAPTTDAEVAINPFLSCADALSGCSSDEGDELHDSVLHAPVLPLPLFHDGVDTVWLTGGALAAVKAFLTHTRALERVLGEDAALLEVAARGVLHLNTSCAVLYLFTVVEGCFRSPDGEAGEEEEDSVRRGTTAMVRALCDAENTAFFERVLDAFPGQWQRARMMASHCNYPACADAHLSSLRDVAFVYATTVKAMGVLLEPSEQGTAAAFAEATTRFAVSLSAAYAAEPM